MSSARHPRCTLHSVARTDPEGSSCVAGLAVISITRSSTYTSRVEALMKKLPLCVDALTCGATGTAVV
eukprot:2646617-Prymnesium_polylepis.1